MNFQGQLEDGPENGESSNKTSHLHSKILDVVIIGAGFSGVCMGHNLLEAGMTDFVILEKTNGIGGTWYKNTYPGAACDIESYVYLPLLEEVGYMPGRKYASGKEILSYSHKIADKYDLYENALLQTEVTEVRWLETEDVWSIKTNRGDEMRASFVIMSNGPLNRPKLPGISGIDKYKGHTFHTSRWDYAYTGGDASGGLQGLKDKRVAIIGTGATAVQCVPHLAAAAKSLHVFQRTPSSIDVRNDAETDQSWVESLEAGWHQDRMDNFNILTSGGIAEKDLVNDGWTEIIRNLLVMVRREKKEGEPNLNLSEQMELADFQKMESIRARAETIVNDPTTAESLKPYYRQFCKRPCFHDDYLAAFNNDKVTLIDTEGKGVQAITETSVVANGETYEVDCIIFATGFEVGTEYSRRCGYEIYGRDGLSLTENWAGGVRTLHGIHSRGFPNCFIMGGNTQTGFTANYPHALKEQSEHIAYIIEQLSAGNHKIVEASQAAEQDWIDTIVSLANANLHFLESCTPGYYNNEGKPSQRALQNANYGLGSDKFFKLLKAWRDEGSLAGLEIN